MTFDGGKYHCKAAMLYEVVESGTRVTWTMSGDMGTPVIGGYFAMMSDHMIGSMFEKGLANLKNKIE